MDVKRIRRGGLVGVTSLALTYVRNGIETHWKGWEGWYEFGLSWFVHWIALILFTVVTAALIKGKAAWFTDTEEKRIPDMDDLMVYITFAVLVALISIWVLAHWIPRDDYGDY